MHKLLRKQTKQKTFLNHYSYIIQTSKLLFQHKNNGAKYIMKRLFEISDVVKRGYLTSWPLSLPELGADEAHPSHL